MTFQEYYIKEVRQKLLSDLKLKNVNEVPKIMKVVINVGAGEAAVNKKILEDIQEELRVITGQKPIVTKAHSSISAFKIRRGMPIGVKVTLRGKRMYDFFDKLIKIVLPRFRDFSGISDTTIDGHGNLNLGIAEQTLFPEIEYDKINKIRGLQVTVVTTAHNKLHGKKLFELVGIPFKK